MNVKHLMMVGCGTRQFDLCVMGLGDVVGVLWE